MEWANLLKPLLIAFIFIFWTSILIKEFFSFEIAILYTISIGTALICMAIVWLENILIKKKENV